MVAFAKMFQGTHSETLRRERPPRLRRFGCFAHFLTGAATLPLQGGESAPRLHLAAKAARSYLQLARAVSERISVYAQLIQHAQH